MNWRHEAYRSVLTSADVDIGAIFPPRGNGGLWRWRIWVTRNGHPIKGHSMSQDRASREIEGRFRDFLDAAQLVEIGGGL